MHHFPASFSIDLPEHNSSQSFSCYDVGLARYWLMHLHPQDPSKSAAKDTLEGRTAALMNSSQPKNEINLETRRYSAVALVVWLLLTILCAASLAGLYLSGWHGRLIFFISEGPSSNIFITLACVGIVWFLAGIILVLLWRGWLNRRNFLLCAGFCLVFLLYVNIIRERTNFGADWKDYYQAAENLRAGVHLHSKYFYPPLWATLLEPLLPFGSRAVFAACWLLNFVSFGAFYFLLVAALRRYGFSEYLSVVVTTLFLLVNVPVFRTFAYVQVNFHVMNLILAGFLLYPRFRAVSASAVAVAVHLKSSPVAFAFGFLLRKDWRWLSWFGIALVGILFATVLINGASPYVDFVKNVWNIYNWRDPDYRDNSIDAWFRTIQRAIGYNPGWTMAFIAIFKLLLLAAICFIVYRCIRKSTFSGSTGTSDVLLDASPALLILMMTASPLVWEHHPVFASLSYLVLLKVLSGPLEWMLFGAAYMLAYLFPTFDFFPWSCGRLASSIIWMYLAWRASGRSGISSVFSRTNAFSLTTSPSQS